MARKESYTKLKIAGLAVVSVGVLLATWLYLRHVNIPVLQPKGWVGQQEKQLIITATLLCLIVVIPVFAMTFWIAWKYRASNHKAKYEPDWDKSNVAEFTWWAIPAAIIFILSIITWNSTHQLDPYKSLASSNKPLTIQVVALDWKWLFIYPDQHIATVNTLEIPVNTPVDFHITADAPMNSLWIPQLGGQVYAMPGMSTELHLIADQPGVYRGSSANISGKGFAGMIFKTHAVSQSDFNAWVNKYKWSPNKLTLDSYNKLAQKSENNPVAYYSLAKPNLYNTVVMKYMNGMDDTATSHQSDTTNNTPSHTQVSDHETMNMTNMEMQ